MFFCKLAIFSVFIPFLCCGFAFGFLSAGVGTESDSINWMPSTRVDTMVESGGSSDCFENETEGDSLGAEVGSFAKVSHTGFSSPAPIEGAFWACLFNLDFFSGVVASGSAIGPDFVLDDLEDGATSPTADGCVSFRFSNSSSNCGVRILPAGSQVFWALRE